MSKSPLLLRGLLTILAAGLLLGLHAGTLLAGTRVVDRVEIHTREIGAEIHIHFNLPLRYLSHTPAKGGELLQIALRSLANGTDIAELAGRDSLNWQPVAGVPLEELSYEGDAPGGPQLLLRFAQAVEFNVQPGSDPLRLIVAISTASADKGNSRQQIPPGSSTEAEPVLPYAINLESTRSPIAPADLPDPEIFAPYRLYSTSFNKDGQLWHRLRLGFFPSKQAAREMLATLHEKYPSAWLTRVTDTERLESRQTVLPPEAPPLAEKPAPVEDQAVSQPTAERLQRWFEEAESAMIDGDYRRAVQLYSKLQQVAEPEQQQQAQELLGLARERNGQFAHAKAEYQAYLQRYPEGEGAARVRQRLTGLLTARSTPKERLRKAKPTPADDGWQTDLYGSLSQYYHRDETFTDIEGRILNRSALRTDLDLGARLQNDLFDIRTSFVGGQESDFLQGGEDASRISALYLDALAQRPNLSLRLGRQSRSSGGLLGRFDGALLRWQASDKLALNLVGGFPVASTSDSSIDSDRYLYGLSLDLGTFAKRWDFNTFIIEQQADGLTDRRSIGGEVRYFHPRRTFFGLLDYDILYRELNTLLLTGNWTLPGKTTLSLSTDYRLSPILTTSNALQGQSVSSLSALLNSYSEEEIRQLAMDRTATSRSHSIGVSHPLTDKLQLSGDLTLAKISGTPASGGVAATSGTGYDYFYALQLIGSSLLKEGDIGIVGLRYADTSSAQTYSLHLNSRYPLTRRLRLNPKLLVDLRQGKANDSEQWKFRPQLRLEYRWRKRWHLELEGGWEWSSEQSAGERDDTQGYFVTLGYRLDF